MPGPWRGLRSRCTRPYCPWRRSPRIAGPVLSTARGRGSGSLSQMALMISLRRHPCAQERKRLRAITHVDDRLRRDNTHRRLRPTARRCRPKTRATARHRRFRPSPDRIQGSKTSRPDRAEAAAPLCVDYRGKQQCPCTRDNSLHRSRLRHKSCHKVRIAVSATIGIASARIVKLPRVDERHAGASADRHLGSGPPAFRARRSGSRRSGRREGPQMLGFAASTAGFDEHRTRAPGLSFVRSHSPKLIGGDTRRDHRASALFGRRNRNALPARDRAITRATAAKLLSVRTVING